MSFDSRTYILEKTETPPDLQQVSAFMAEELTYAYSILRRLMRVVVKFGEIPQQAKLDDVILNNLLDYHDPTTGPQAAAALQRLEVQIASNRSEGKVDWKKVKNYIKLIVAIAGAITTTYHVIKPHYQRMRQNRVMKANKSYIHRVYDTVYIPGLTKIYRSIMGAKTKNENHLKSAFFKLIDKIIYQYPPLAYTLELWGAPDR